MDCGLQRNGGGAEYGGSGDGAAAVGNRGSRRVRGGERNGFRRDVWQKARRGRLESVDCGSDVRVPNVKWAVTALALFAGVDRLILNK